jgi:hypothetical protein
MSLSPKKKILIGAVVLIEIVLIIWGLIYRQNRNQDFALVQGKDFNGSMVLEISLEKTSFPTSFEGFEVLGFQVASTGRISKLKLKDGTSGELLGEATILETVSRDRGDPDNLIRLSLIVQFASVGNPDRNVLPWVLKEAARLSSISISSDSPILSEDQIKEIFPRGSIWSLIPLVDLGREQLDKVVELSSYAQRYYGGNTYPELEKLFQDSPDRHSLLGEVSKPIFLLEVVELPLE